MAAWTLTHRTSSSLRAHLHTLARATVLTPDDRTQIASVVSPHPPRPTSNSSGRPGWCSGVDVHSTGSPTTIHGACSGLRSAPWVSTTGIYGLMLLCDMARQKIWCGD